MPIVNKICAGIFALGGFVALSYMAFGWTPSPKVIGMAAFTALVGAACETLTHDLKKH